MVDDTFFSSRVKTDSKHSTEFSLSLSTWSFHKWFVNRLGDSSAFITTLRDHCGKFGCDYIEIFDRQGGVDPSTWILDLVERLKRTGLSISSIASRLRLFEEKRRVDDHEVEYSTCLRTIISRVKPKGLRIDWGFEWYENKNRTQAINRLRHLNEFVVFGSNTELWIENHPVVLERTEQVDTFFSAARLANVKVVLDIGLATPVAWKYAVEKYPNLIACIHLKRWDCDITSEQKGFDYFPWLIEQFSDRPVLFVVEGEDNGNASVDGLVSLESTFESLLRKDRAGGSRLNSSRHPSNFVERKGGQCASRELKNETPNRFLTEFVDFAKSALNEGDSQEPDLEVAVKLESADYPELFPCNNLCKKLSKSKACEDFHTSSDFDGQVSSSLPIVKYCPFGFTFITSEIEYTTSSSHDSPLIQSRPPQKVIIGPFLEDRAEGIATSILTYSGNSHLLSMVNESIPSISPQRLNTLTELAPVIASQAKVVLWNEEAKEQSRVILDTRLNDIKANLSRVYTIFGSTLAEVESSRLVDPNRIEEIRSSFRDATSELQIVVRHTEQQLAQLADVRKQPILGSFRSKFELPARVGQHKLEFFDQLCDAVGPTWWSRSFSTNWLEIEIVLQWVSSVFSTPGVRVKAVRFGRVGSSHQAKRDDILKIRIELGFKDEVKLKHTLDVFRRSNARFLNDPFSGVSISITQNGYVSRLDVTFPVFLNLVIEKSCPMFVFEAIKTLYGEFKPNSYSTHEIVAQLRNWPFEEPFFLVCEEPEISEIIGQSLVNEIIERQIEPTRQVFQCFFIDEIGSRVQSSNPMDDNKSIIASESDIVELIKNAAISWKKEAFHRVTRNLLAIE